MKQDFYYYQGDWITGKKLLMIVHETSLTIADKQFQELTGINPQKNQTITVTLIPLTLE